jgi:hypothetical protein
VGAQTKESEMEKTKIDALRAFASDVRFQSYAREAIADALELIAAEVEAVAERLDKLEALMLQLAPPAEPVAAPVAGPAPVQQAGADTNVGA